MMTRAVLAVLVGATVLAAAPAAAQQQTTPPVVARDFSKVEVKTTDLGRGTYMLEGEGGNITVAVAEDGVIMVDSQFAPMHDKIKAAIAALTSQPIRFLVNTHHHGDHSGGNEGFGKDGVTIVAHVNARNRLAAGTTHNLSGITTPPYPAIALPTKTYTDTTTLELKGRSAQLKHPERGHTDGDTAVYFADANVLATGDTVNYPRYPNSDFLNGGSIKGMIAAVDFYLGFINDDTKIVPGHGRLIAKPQLLEYRAMLTTARDRMAALIAEGKSEAEVQAQKPFADLDAKWAPTAQAARNFTRVVYVSLKP